jgi:Flp pilus assembly protein CpaB
MRPQRIASFISWHRRAIAALLAALCVAGIVSVAKAPPPPGEPVIAAVQPLAAGHTVTEADLALVELPAERVTDATLRNIDEAVGAVTAVALDAGQVLTAASLLSADPAEDGRALVPISVSDPELRELLQPGTTVSLVVALGEAPEVVTNSARVARMPAEAGGSMGFNQSGGGLVVVDVPAEVAGVVATLGQNGQLVVVLGRL